MSYIYTISHPFTNEVVYVGCTEDFERRRISYVRQKKVFRPIDQYILDLRDNFMYPKIEILDEVPKDIALEEEMFWMRMMRSWGFNLLNISKLIPPINPQYDTIPSSYTGLVKTRTSRKWYYDMFRVGNILEVGDTTKTIFTASFKNYCRKFEVNLFLKYSKDGKTATIISEKPKRQIRVKKGFWPKGAERKQRETPLKTLIQGLRVIGAEVKIEGTSFVTLKTSISYHLRDIENKRMKYTVIDKTTTIVKRIY